MTVRIKADINMSDFSRLAYLLKKYASPYWKAMIFLILANFLVAFIAALSPLIMAPILDIALGKDLSILTDASQKITFGNLSLKNLGAAMLQILGLAHSTERFRTILLLSGLFFGVTVLRRLADFGRYLLALWVRVRCARDMQYDLYKHILSLSLGFFNKQRTGELMSRMDTDTTATTGGFERIVSNLITSPLLIIVYGALLVRTSPRVAIAAFIGGISHYALTKAIQKPIRRHMTDQFSIFADLRATLQEAIQGIRVVKSFSAEGYELKKLGNAITNLIRINMKYGVFKHIEDPVRAIVNRFIEIGILIFVSWELISGHMDAATFFLFLYVGRSIMNPISVLGKTVTSFQNTLAASERVFELFSEKPNVQDGVNEIFDFKNTIQINNVSFAYDTRKVLKNIDLKIKKGEIVALVGPSGAGKSTLSDLILRLYDPTDGDISIDGRDLRLLKQASYRRLFGMVPQESLLFNSTVKENIAYGRADLPEEDIIFAAKVANAHEFIIDLPKGYDTLVGDRGIRLSGGQRQRVAIARAIVCRPSIIILDEATSSLDSESEKLVQQAIDRVINKNTGIVIAHRLSTVIRADKIVVMDKGSILDQGSHEELQKRCELYSRLCELQFNMESEFALNDKSDEKMQEEKTKGYAIV